MKSRLIILSLVVLPFLVKAQLENAAFTETGRGAATAFATDYHALGINPANLAFGNRYNKKFTLGIGQVGASIYSEAFDRQDFSRAIFGVDDELTAEEKQEIASDFASSDLAANVYSTLLGFAVNTENAGNFAVSVNFRATYFSNLNDNAASQLFSGFVDPYFNQWVVEDQDGNTSVIPNQGANYDNLENVILGQSTNPQFASDLYSGTRIRSMAFTEINLGYGRNVYESDDLLIHAGVGLKYLQGLFVMDLNIDDGGVVDAFAAVTPAAGIDLGEEDDNPSFVEGDGYTPVGDGFGFDLGLAAEVGDQFRVSVAVTDIGSILFDGNVFTSGDTVVFDIETDGIDSYNVFTQFDDFAGDDGVFDWTGQEERRVNLPTQLRTGIGYFHNEKLRIGLDLALPLNDEPANIENAAFALGAEFLPSESFSLSAGIGAGDNFGFRVPFGVNFIVDEGTWEFGLATRDLLYAFKDNRPNISLVMGLLRFRFGEMGGEQPSRMY